MKWAKGKIKKVYLLLGDDLLKKYIFVSLSFTLVLTGALLLRGEVKTSRALSSLNSLLDGAQTCFMRVNQSYSARMIGLDSSYLKKDFLTQTENCFNDLKALAQKHERLNSVMESIDSISDQTYWFHRQQDFENPFTASDDYQENEGYQNVITEKFKKIETLSEVIVENLKLEREKILKNQPTSFIFKSIFILLFGGGVFWLMKLIIFRRKGIKVSKSSEVKTVPTEDLSFYNKFENQGANLAKPKINKMTEETQGEIEVIVQTEPCDYGREIKAIIKDLSPRFFNLNTSLNFSGLDNLCFPEKVKFNQDRIKQFLHQVARFTAGGKYPVQVEISKFKKDNQYHLNITATNTNHCVFLDEDVKKSIVEIKEIITHDNIILGFCLESVFLDESKTKNIGSIFVGQKKDLLKKIKVDSKQV
jgi:hypothetical protein